MHYKFETSILIVNEIISQLSGFFFYEETSTTYVDLPCNEQEKARQYSVVISSKFDTTETIISELGFLNILESIFMVQ